MKKASNIMLWFDLDNSPHVPLFRPIISKLTQKGMESIITAREYAQTIELLDLWKMKYQLIGKHAGKNKARKILNLFGRAGELRNFIKGKNISLAVSHGSRTQVMTAKFSGIRSLVMMDYEYTENRIFNYLGNYILMPAIIPEKRLKDAGINLKKLMRYNGFKEEIYLQSFKPDSDFRKSLGINDDEILIVIRPPAIVSNYHNINSEKLFLSSVKYFSSFDNAKIILLSRTESDKKLMEDSNLISKVIFLEKPVDGLQLLYHADITLSGGGTMNRESALLGTETYSIFGGKRPYIDEYLFENKMLNFIDNLDDFYKIEVTRKPKTGNMKFSDKVLNEIVNLILNLNN
jgi:uncharacterized protein